MIDTLSMIPLTTAAFRPFEKEGSAEGANEQEKQRLCAESLTLSKIEPKDKAHACKQGTAAAYLVCK